MSSTMDSIAVTFHTLLTHEAKNLSSSLEIPTPELINLQSYLKLYLKDDPALFFLELSIRFIIEKQADFFSDQWNSLFKWLRTHKGKAPYEAILKVPSNPFKNLFERVEDEDEARKMKLSPEQFIDAQFAAFDWKKAIPEVSQLAGEKAVERAVKYMYQNEIKPNEKKPVKIDFSKLKS
jgi:hypothetical protein